MGLLDRHLLAALSDLTAHQPEDDALRLSLRGLSDAQLRGLVVAVSAHFRAVKHEAQRRGLWDGLVGTTPPVLK